MAKHIVDKIKKRKILFVFGTRPEGIKLAPLIREFTNPELGFLVKVCITAQHREMLDGVINFFGLAVDFDLNLMKSGQTLFDITSKGLEGMKKVLEEYQPDLIFVQGDTITALVGALAGYYEKIKVAHIEAGLRSFNKFSPFPEEINRVLISHIADYHFCPTAMAKNNLQNEGIKKNVFVVGNTVVDALNLGLKIVQKNYEKSFREKFSFIDFDKKMILVTGHRRESFGETFENMCSAMLDIVQRNSDVEIVYPVHFNPNVRKPVNKILKNKERVHLIEPVEYPEMVWLMKQSYLILTDSGGIQEESPSLGKPVLVMREVTEREEGIKAGTAKLVGTNKNRIVEEVEKLLRNKRAYSKMAKSKNPYGDGKASYRIRKIIEMEIDKIWNN